MKSCSQKSAKMAQIRTWLVLIVCFFVNYSKFVNATWSDRSVHPAVKSSSNHPDDVFNSPLKYFKYKDDNIESNNIHNNPNSNKEIEEFSNDYVNDNMINGEYYNDENDGNSKKKSNPESTFDQNVYDYTKNIDNDIENMKYDSANYYIDPDSTFVSKKSDDSNNDGHDDEKNQENEDNNSKQDEYDNYDYNIGDFDDEYTDYNEDKPEDHDQDNSFEKKYNTENNDVFNDEELHVDDYKSGYIN